MPSNSHIKLFDLENPKKGDIDYEAMINIIVADLKENSDMMEILLEEHYGVKASVEDGDRIVVESADKDLKDIF